MDPHFQVTYVCKKCHGSFSGQKQPERSWIARLFSSGGTKCPKCGASDIAEADSAPLTTKTFRKKV